MEWKKPNCPTVDRFESRLQSPLRQWFFFSVNLLLFAAFFTKGTDSLIGLNTAQTKRDLTSDEPIGISRIT